mmetsp:Transcript_22529/g.64873  ORF Transcript_22529/g.64873 Transcript_22529/m.64873 type:complete len:235 (+) Transcript_22529:365-1069(+)
MLQRLLRGERRSGVAQGDRLLQGLGAAGCGFIRKTAYAEHVGDDAARPHVDHRAIGLAIQHFRGHESEGAADARADAPVLRERARQAEIAQFHRVVRTAAHEVVRFYITVHDASEVDEGQGPQHVAEVWPKHSFAQHWEAIQRLPQCLIAPLHDDERQSVLYVAAYDGARIGMPRDFRQMLHLPPEIQISPLVHLAVGIASWVHLARRLQQVDDLHDQPRVRRAHLRHGIHRSE